MWWLWTNGGIERRWMLWRSSQMIIVGFCGADRSSIAAACTVCIASACRKRSRGSQRPISGSSFCNAFCIHRSERCQCCHAPRCVCVAPHGCVLCTWLCGIHCVPRRGGTALSGMQLGTWARMASAAAARVAACALLAISSSSLLCLHASLRLGASPIPLRWLRRCA